MGITQKLEIITNRLKRNRSKSRSLALQTLFEIDLAKHHIDDVLGHLMVESDLDKSHLDFTREIVHGVIDKQKQIDNLIAQCATERQVGDLSSLDRSVLRMGILELIDFPQTPPKVVVNEAVELAKIYGSDNSYKFVNGVLGSVLQKLKIEE